MNTTKGKMLLVDLAVIGAVIMFAYYALTDLIKQRDVVPAPEKVEVLKTPKQPPEQFDFCKIHDCKG